MTKRLSRDYLFSANWMFFEHCLKLLGGVFVGSYIARYLGTEQFGFFSFVLALFVLFEPFCRSGVESVFGKDYSNCKVKNDVLSSYFFYRLSLGIIIFLLFSIFSLSFSDAITSKGIKILAFIFLFQAFEVLDYQFQIEANMRKVTIVKIFFTILFMGIKFFFIYKKYNLESFFVAYTLERCCALLASFLVFEKKMVLKIFRFDASNFYRIFKDSFPMLISTFSIILYSRMDHMIIKNILGLKDLGVYSAVVRLTESCFFLPVIISNAFFPQFLSGRLKGKFYTLYSIVPCIFTCLLISSLSNFVISFLYGEAFMSAVPILQFNIYVLLFYSVGYSFTRILVKANLQKYVIFSTVFGIIVNYLLNLKLIPVLGIMGASISSLVSYFIANVIGLLLFKKPREVIFS